MLTMLSSRQLMFGLRKRGETSRQKRDHQLIQSILQNLTLIGITF